MRVRGPLGRLLAALALVATGLGTAGSAAQADTTPVIESVQVSTPTLDVTESAGELDVVMTIRGEGAATAQPTSWIGLTSTTSTQRFSIGSSATTTSADGTHAALTYHVPFRQGAAPGRWDLAFSPVYDGTGWVELTIPAGQPDHVDLVSRDADIAAPTVESLSLDTDRVGTQYGEGQVHFQAHVTDRSGVENVQFRATPPGADAEPVYASMVRKSGDPLDGEYEAWMAFPQGAPAGVWPLTYIASDSLGNEVDGPMPPGYPAGITVHHDPVAPWPPDIVTARGGDRFVTATWEASPNSGGSPLTGYVATLLPEGRTITVGPSTLTATFDGLGDGEQHTVSVAAVNDVGTGPDSVPSAPAYTWALPPAPTAVTATARDASATVQWTASAWSGTAVTEYVVTMSPGGVQTTMAPQSGAAQKLTIGGLTNGTAYTFTVRAVNAKGEGAESAPTSPVVPVARPAAPTMTAATPVATGQVRLQWSAPADTGVPVTRYRLWVTDVPAARVVSSLWVDGSTTTATVSELLGGHDYRFSAQSENSSGLSAISAGIAARTLPSGGDYFSAVKPVRALDTRYGTGARAGRVGPGTTVTFTVPGLPAGARAVAINLTATGASSSTYVTAYAAGSPRPTTSNLNVVSGETRAAFAMVPVSKDGKVTLYNNRGWVHLIVDVTGSFRTSAGSAFVGQQPTRMLDTRTGVGTATSGQLGAGKEIVLSVASLPTTATAVVLNLTATGPTAATHLTVYPGGVARPNASNLNVVAGSTVANLVTVGIGADRTIRIYNSQGSVDVVADVSGYYSAVAGTGYASRTPTRVLDTRNGTGAPVAPVSTTPLRLRIPGLPEDAREVALTVTVTRPSGAGHLTVYPGTSTKPTASSLNFRPGQSVANHVVVPLGSDGTVLLAVSNGTADLVADLAGVFVP